MSENEMSNITYLPNAKRQRIENFVKRQVGLLKPVLEPYYISVNRATLKDLIIIMGSDYNAEDVCAILYNSNDAIWEAYKKPKAVSQGYRWGILKNIIKKEYEANREFISRRRKDRLNERD